jgi:predicted RNase H-like HicB family nuclease
MRKDELEQQNQHLELKCKRLANLLTSTQTRALDSIRLLEEAVDVGGCDWKDPGVRQVYDRLARIVDPAAHNQDQANQTVQQFRELGPRLFDALKQYMAGVFEESVPHDIEAFTANSVEEAIAHAMDIIELYTGDPGRECDASSLTEALEALRLALTLVVAGVVPEKEAL